MRARLTAMAGIQFKQLKHNLSALERGELPVFVAATLQWIETIVGSE